MLLSQASSTVRVGQAGCLLPGQRLKITEGFTKLLVQRLLVQGGERAMMGGMASDLKTRFEQVVDLILAHELPAGIGRVPGLSAADQGSGDKDDGREAELLQEWEGIQVKIFKSIVKGEDKRASQAAALVEVFQELVVGNDLVAAVS